MTHDPHAIRAYFSGPAEGRADPMRPNPLFAGREDVLVPIVERAHALARSPGSLPNTTTVVFGAPGAGKTELLGQLRERLRGRPFAVVAGGAELLVDPGALGLAVFEGLGPEDRSCLEGTCGWKVDGATLSMPGIGSVSMSKGQKKPPLVDPQGKWERLSALGRAVAKLEPPPTLVLFVDEAQAELREAARQGGHFVQALHAGRMAGMKIMPVFAGLGDTLDALRVCGLSRLDGRAKHLLNRLSDGRVHNMALTGIQALTGTRPHTVETWAGRVVDYAQGWPMHSAHALRAVADRSRPGGWRLDNEGFESAMRDARLLREDYYTDRLRACPLLRESQYGRWAGLFQSGNRNAEHVAETLHMPLEDADALCAQAVAAGLLEPVGATRFHAPIPSMIGHIGKLGR